MKTSYIHLLPFLISLLFNFEVCNCSEFLEPKVLSAFEESFILNDIEYVFTDQRVTWEEAEIGCSSIESGSLAIIDNEEKAYFLALALAETDLILEDVWIGASTGSCPKFCRARTCEDDCGNNTCFIWRTGSCVKSEFMLPRFNEINITKRECLSFARNNHQLPSFVDLYCKLKRPYLCQRPAIQEDGDMTHPEWIRVEGYEYAIFYAKKTWKESVRECFSKHKANLADFRTMREVAGIGRYLLTGRPSLENAWIGGHYKDGQWRYISIDDVIPKERNPETMYPPWPETNNSLPLDGCLLLDRHLQDGKKLVFLQARCHRRKSYICSRRILERGENSSETIVIDGQCYTLFYTPKTWLKAEQTCIEHHAWLVEVTRERVDHILYIMGENRTEINHIWIGGKLKKDNKWYWIESKEIIQSDNNTIFNGYPPWLDTLFDQYYACLNMDRENHNIAMFYGVNCEEKQPFICQQYLDCPKSANMLTRKPPAKQENITKIISTDNRNASIKATITTTTTFVTTTTTEEAFALFGNRKKSSNQ